MSSWSRAVVWSLIAAAFIGPGTVTTAARAGSEGGWGYLPFVLLAAFAGFLLMEMAARLTLVSGQTLGQILGTRRRWLAIACFVAVLLGCVAYQAGNLVGALGGLQLFFGLERWWVLVLGAIAGVVLWPGETKWIARALAGVVIIMAVVFIVAAIQLFLGGASFAGNNTVATGTVIGLVGTTIVPYNFFLAAGLSKGQQLGDMRNGLLLSFLVGGIITLCIVLVGSVATSFTNFSDLARTLDAVLGDWSKVVLGIGLFAAGFSSAVTAPLAAAIAGRELLVREAGEHSVVKQVWFRMIWGGVLVVGLLVALLEIDIITVILAAQVANGLLLPLIAAIVLVFANDRSLLGGKVNAHWQNAAGWLVASFLAYKNFELLLEKVLVSGIGFWAEALTLVYAVGLTYFIYRRR
ncbi:NRAMP family divalent metal transporter [Neolewinella persica]|uniref:NRAMP family divalent metal transporter n=1 Tax=Neolewinella persica TaxID=70998 RepID=UPI000360679A|nr:divalent metal cation transporter [Neolewinella persica]